MRPGFALVALAVALFCVATTSDAQEPAFQFSRQLSPTFTLSWTVDRVAGNVTFGVEVATTGWFGFGVSPTGQMPGSDMVMGWYDEVENKAVLSDRHAVGRSLPLEDAHQDWHLINGSVVDGKLVFSFWREFRTCDTEEDLPIEGTSRLLWAHGAVHPAAGARAAVRHEVTLDIHDSAGSFMMNLANGPEAVPDLSAPGLLRVRLGPTAAAVTSAYATTYHCSSMRLPSDMKYHAIAAIPAIADAVHVHHIVVFACEAPTDEAAFLASSGDCYRGSLDVQVRRCFRSGAPIFAWAVGGETFYLPSEAGVPMGGDGYTHVVVQMHYDNPDRATFMDSSGIDVVYTPQLRTHDASSFWIGHDTSSFVLPPGEAAYALDCYSSVSCSSALFPASGLTVFGIGLHTHLAGTAVEVNASRGGVELEPYARNLAYAFDYQNVEYLAPPRVALPGDRFFTRCTYNTMGRTEATYAGESTMNEMCLAYVMYYPRINLTAALQAELAVPFVASAFAAGLTAELGYNTTHVAEAVAMLTAPAPPSTDPLVGSDERILRAFFARAGVTWTDQEKLLWHGARAITPQVTACFTGTSQAVPYEQVNADARALTTRLPPPPPSAPCPPPSPPPPPAVAHATHANDSAEARRIAVIAGLVVGLSCVLIMLALVGCALARKSPTDKSFDAELDRIACTSLAEFDAQKAEKAKVAADKAKAAPPVPDAAPKTAAKSAVAVAPPVTVVTPKAAAAAAAAAGSTASAAAASAPPKAAEAVARRARHDTVAAVAAASPASPKTAAKAALHASDEYETASDFSSCSR